MKYLFLLSLTTLFLACRSIQPEAPVSDIVQPPLNDQPLSTLVIPISINLTSYFKEVEKSLPYNFKDSDQKCEGISYAYNFFRKPLQFEGRQDFLDFNIKGKYNLKLNYCPTCTDLFTSENNCVIPRVYVSCGISEPMRNVELGYTSTFSITPSYKLKSKTKLNFIDLQDPCEFTVFNFDASSILKTELTKALKSLERDIDKEIGKIDLKPEAEEAWRILSKPISIGEYGFLYAQPRNVGIQDIKFQDNYAFTALSLEFKPVISTEALTIEEKPLPKLKETSKDEGFSIQLDILSSYDSLTKILNKELGGTEVDLKGKKILFDNFEIVGASDKKIHIKVSFSGKKHGVFYLNGTPSYNSGTHQISIPDLAFDLESKSVLLKSAKWIFNKKITDIIKTSAQMDLSPHLIKLRNMLETELNKPIQEGVNLNTRISELDIIGIYPLETTLIIRIKTKGKISVEL
jgi:hypothetical protein